MKTDNNNPEPITGIEKISPSSLGSESKNLSEFNGKEESKAQTLKYSEPNSVKNSEEIDSIEKYTEEDIKDLIDEAEQEVYTRRKRYSSLFNYESLSEYFRNKKYYQLTLLYSDDSLLFEYNLSDFEEFGEFASDPRWKDQISISSQNKITVYLSTEKNIKFLSLIKTRLGEFETLKLYIHEEKCEIIRNFLTNYFPENGQYFKFFCNIRPNLRINYYFNSLIKLNFRVTQELCISHWELSQHQIITIFKEFKHVRSLKFEWGILALESVPEFGSFLEESKIKELELRGNEYGDNDYGVEHLIEGLSQSNGFLQNLDRISIYGSGNTEETKEKLKEYVDIEKLVIKLYIS